MLGYAPGPARERLRVADALAALPKLRAAMSAGEVAYSAARELTRVATTPVDCVLIGAGLRKTDQVLVLFEQIVNAVRVACPGAALCFNTVPEDSAEAVRRWLARP